MAKNADIGIKQIHERIARIQKSLSAVDYLCSGTILKRMKKCGKPSCRCAQDPSARHGPYFEWGHMVEGPVGRSKAPTYGRVKSPHLMST